jgi:hypothetical protein
LSNQSRIYNREKRRRRKARDVQAADEDADDLFAEDEGDSEKNDFREECNEEDIVNDGLGSERKRGNIPDMYKALDGSALMAIGTPRLRKLNIQS